ncbi:MAG: DUF4918 family protein [Bacteroidales bacterium]|nr:DUF4918 family protein [Bacteroidales bacterium]MBN2820141.1 DUF4918 family protein [Bacteroidales bacterium]
MIGNNLHEFFTNLDFKYENHSKIEVLNPYSSANVIKISEEFYTKYYNDNNPRVLILGINPGRFGAGITGISFTDPIELENNLGIMNDFEKKPELSAGFIHEVIGEYGGPSLFYNKFLVSAVCPLGFTKDGININYYDDKDLFEKSKSFIIKTLKKQVELVNNNSVCFCIGQGKNLKFLQEINRTNKFFKTLEVLPHPRWIMQYRRKQKDFFIKEYIKALKKNSV